MRINEKNGTCRITIQPGEYYVSRDKVIISTLLGSCVSVCMYDPIKRVVGMNHFLLAHKRRYPQDIPIIQSEAGRYGINAMELVINEMMKQGAQRRNLRAKVFGGGDVLRYYKNGRNNFFYVGEVNCRFAREFLKNETIPVVASDLGGDYGRVIHFQSTDFAVYMKKIAHSKDTADIEHNYWKKTIQQQDELEQKETQFW